MIWLKLDCLNPDLQQVKIAPTGKTPETGAASCAGIFAGPAHPPGCGAMPSEGIEGDEWGAYVTLSRIAGTNAGSPTGREPYGDRGPVVVAGVMTCQGGR